MYSLHCLCNFLSLTLTLSLFFFNDTPPTEIYTLSLHDALPISRASTINRWKTWIDQSIDTGRPSMGFRIHINSLVPRDRKSTRLNSSHVSISYAVFCLKKKIKKHQP